MCLTGAVAGQQPPISTDDVDCSGGVNVADLVQMVGYLFQGGDAPCEFTVGGAWGVQDSVLYTAKYWGIARGQAGNVLLGADAHTHVNLGSACTTGTLDQDLAYCTIAGGFENVASGQFATVSGGWWNRASGDSSTVGGGLYNWSRGKGSTIGGGFYNEALSDASTVAGGAFNSAEGWDCTVGGGVGNHAEGDASTVCGGDGNYVGGSKSLTAGYYNHVADSAHFSYLFGISSTLTQDSTLMIDMPTFGLAMKSQGTNSQPTTDRKDK